MAERRGNASVYLALVVLSLVWGYTWVAIKLATHDASPYVVAGHAARHRDADPLRDASADGPIAAPDAVRSRR